MQRQLSNITQKALLTPSTVEKGKTLGQRIFEGSIKSGKDDDLVALNTPSASNPFIPLMGQGLQTAYDAFASDLVYLLSKEELYNLNQLLTVTELFTNDTQAFRTTTIAKALVRAEAQLYPENNSNDAQYHTTLMNHVGLMIKDGSPFPNMKGDALTRAVYTLVSFNMFNIPRGPDIDQKAMLFDNHRQQTQGQALQLSTDIDANAKLQRAQIISQSKVVALAPDYQFLSKTMTEIINDDVFWKGESFSTTGITQHLKKPKGLLKKVGDKLKNLDQKSLDELIALATDKITHGSHSKIAGTKPLSDNMIAFLKAIQSCKQDGGTALDNFKKTNIAQKKKTLGLS